jgi:hypothetical protein
MPARLKLWAQPFKESTRDPEIRSLETLRETFEYTCQASASFGGLAFAL